MTSRPWMMTAREIASAEEAVRDLVAADVVPLLCPVLRAEHLPVVEAIERLAWTTGPIAVVADQALNILTDCTQPGGPIDPADDCGDVVWAMMLGKLYGAPATGTKMARAWFVHGMRLLWADVDVSAVHQAIAAYAVARFEDALAHRHEFARWMMTAGLETEVDDRAGLGLAVVIRAARLFAWPEPLG